MTTGSRPGKAWLPCIARGPFWGNSGFSNLVEKPTVAEVFQLPDIPGPVIFLQTMQATSRQWQGRAVVFYGVVLEEIFRKHRNIFSAVPQGRQVNAHGVEEVKQIGPEFAALHLSLD